MRHIYVYREHKGGEPMGFAFGEDCDLIYQTRSTTFWHFRQDMGLDNHSYPCHEAYTRKYKEGYSLIELIGPEAWTRVFPDEKLPQGGYCHNLSHYPDSTWHKYVTRLLDKTT